MEYYDLGWWLKFRDVQVFSWWWKLEVLGKNHWAERYTSCCRASGWVSRSWAGDELFWLQLRIVRLEQDRTFQKGGKGVVKGVVGGVAWVWQNRGKGMVR